MRVDMLRPDRTWYWTRTTRELWNGEWWRWYWVGDKPVAFVREP